MTCSRCRAVVSISPPLWWRRDGWFFLYAPGPVSRNSYKAQLFCGVRVACVWLCVLFARKLKKDQRPAQNHPSHTSHKKREKRLPQRAKGKGQSTTKKRERERQCVERSLLPCEEYAQQRAK